MANFFLTEFICHSGLGGGLDWIVPKVPRVVVPKQHVQNFFIEDKYDERDASELMLLWSIGILEEAIYMCVCLHQGSIQQLPGYVFYASPIMDRHVHP